MFLLAQHRMQVLVDRSRSEWPLARIDHGERRRCRCMQLDTEKRWIVPGWSAEGGSQSEQTRGQYTSVASHPFGKTVTKRMGARRIAPPCGYLISPMYAPKGPS